MNVKVGGVKPCKTKLVVFGLLNKEITVFVTVLAKVA